MNKTTIAGVIVGLVLGAGIGYVFASSGSGDKTTDAKKLQDSVTMMNQQSASITEMSNMMKSTAMMMQTAGTKYKDDTLVQQGKDLEAVAAKNTQTNNTSSSQGSMQQMMGQ